MSAVEIEGLEVTFIGGARPVRAVRGVNLQVDRGETVPRSTSPARARA